MQINGYSYLAPELIVWEDISVCPETWASGSDIERWHEDVSDALVEQVGYVLYEDDHLMIISESFIEAMELYGTVTKIPKSVIRKRVKLKQVEQNEQFSQSNQDNSPGLLSGLSGSTGTVPNNNFGTVFA